MLARQACGVPYRLGSRNISLTLKVENIAIGRPLSIKSKLATPVSIAFTYFTCAF